MHASPCLHVPYFSQYQHTFPCLGCFLPRLPLLCWRPPLLAALRGGITTVLIPEDNAKDLAEIPDNVKNGLEIIPVSRMEDVLKTALERTPEPIEWDEAAADAAREAVRAQAEAAKPVAH